MSIGIDPSSEDLSLVLCQCAMLQNTKYAFYMFTDLPSPMLYILLSWRCSMQSMQAFGPLLVYQFAILQCARCTCCHLVYLAPVTVFASVPAGNAQGHCCCTSLPCCSTLGVHVKTKYTLHLSLASVPARNEQALYNWMLQGSV